MNHNIKVELLEHPTNWDWMQVKRRALVTIGKDTSTVPDLEWKESILRARHSPIRRLMFSFYIECPYWVSTHVARHVHCQPYIRSQRNDRQDQYDRNAARQDAKVKMIVDFNSEAFLVFLNKRLCKQASEETQEVARKMRDIVWEANPEFRKEMVPMCARNGGVCHEMKSCKED